jgi:hypothetical protein
MSSPSLIAALDMTNKINNMQLGENEHPEYKWSSNLKDKIVEYFYQIAENGSNEHTLYLLKNTYTSLVNDSLNLSQNNNERLTYINTLYKLIGQTRDIVAGKGLYNITYMMISVWAKIGLITPKYNEFGITLAKKAIENLIINLNNEHPIGSWKDIKYFCNYWKCELGILGYPTLKDVDILNKDPIFNYVKSVVKNQLKNDERNYNNNTNNLSLLCKWLPRENSNKFGWLAAFFAEDYYNNYLKVNNPEKLHSARIKCYTHYRILITNINKQLNTTQIYQCNRNWKDINFNKNVTSITLRKQSFAFQNKTKKGVNRNYSDFFTEEDRKKCAENYKQYIKECSEGKKTIKAKNISIIDLVRAADNMLYDENNKLEILALNTQWKEQCKLTSLLNNMIAMVDTSGSMEVDNLNPLYSAIGLGLRVAEKSSFGKRVLTFSNNPEWINLDDCPDFVSSVKKIRKAPWGMNTNFYSALSLILNTAIDNNISPEALGNTTLVIFSDMQIDSAISSNNGSYSKPDLNSMFENISKSYKEAGLKSKYNKPYPVPHIIFWNLRTTNGFPNLSETPNTSMLSGSNPNLLNLFLDKGPKILEDITPWKLLQESLSNKRYDKFDINFK